MRFPALFTTLFFAVPALADAPLTEHFSGSDSCYERQYSKTHLAKYQQQQVVEIQLSHFPGDQQFLGLGDNYHSYPETPVLSLLLSIRLRGQNLGQTQLYCTQDGDRLHCGLECDAGHFYVTDHNAGSILIEGGGDLYFSDCGEEERVLRRQPDDKIFLLHRLPASSCQP